MILIISDGSKIVAEIEKQLDLYEERYIVYFSDIRSAGISGKGTALVGTHTVGSVASAIADNYASAVIDACSSDIKLSEASQMACAENNVNYVKCLDLKEVENIRTCLYYSKIADMIIKASGNTLLYAKPETVSGIADFVGEEHVEKMFVPVEKALEFDAKAALEYSIPLLNVIETEWLWGKDSVCDMVSRTNATLIICDDAENIEDKIFAAKEMGAYIIYTHSGGREYPRAAANARDAVIAVHNLQR